MSLDTEPIRARLDAIEDALDYDVTDTSLLRQAPTDISALLAEVDRLTADNEALRAERALSVAVCPDCGEVTRCDEDRCCVSCGRDLIILADRHSADLLIELTGENMGAPANPTKDPA